MAAITTLQQLAAIFTYPAFWLGWIALAAGLALIARCRRLRWWPAWLARMFLAALLLPGLFLSSGAFHAERIPARQVLLVDGSDSLDAATRQEMLRRAMTWRAGGNTAAGENRLLVVFGANAEAVLSGDGEGPPGRVEGTPPAQGVPAMGGMSAGVDGRASDLAGALRLAGQLLGGAAGRVLLASDGLVAHPAEIDREVARLARAGATLDVIPLAPRTAANDLALGGLSAPKNLWAGANLDLLVPVLNEGKSPVKLTLTINGQPANLNAEPAGPGSYQFRLTNLPEGIVTLQVTASAPGAAEPDPLPENNSAYAVLHVFASPRVGLVSGDPDTASAFHFQAILNEHGIQSERIAPADLPTNLADL